MNQTSDSNYFVFPVRSAAVDRAIGLGRPCKTAEITSEMIGDLAILTVSGRLVFDQSLLRLRDETRRLLKAGINKFVFDVSRVPHCDSCGFGELIGVFVSVRKAGGAAAFLNSTERLRALWKRTRLNDVFNFFETLEEAEAFVRQ